MKKYLLMFLFGFLLASCSNILDDNKNIKLQDNRMKETEVLVYSGNNQINTSRAIDYKSEIGFSVPDNGRYLVYYFVRFDGNIPGEDEVNLPAEQYFPRTSAKKTMISDLNHGYVNANANWRSCAKFSKYIYATDGKAVQDLILEEPTLEDLVAANGYKNDDFTGYLKNKDKLHFIWYACKRQDSDHTWHIDGIVTSVDRKDISETKYGKDIIDDYNNKGMTKDTTSVVRKEHIEVDIHQQEHKDWNEIKTSIHLRDTAEVEVFLPIGYQELADDFDIRYGVDYAYITEVKNTNVKIGDNTYTLDVSIKHESDGIRITIKPNKEALIAARKEYEDGITYEIHSYVSPEITSDVIWNMLKNSTCKTTSFLYGQITSAYNSEIINF